MNPWVKGAVTVSLTGILAIAGYEGIKVNPAGDAIAYKDPVNITTICYGHTGNVKMGDVKTVKECTNLLGVDAKIAADAVLKATKVPLSQMELDAYTSFTLNAGAAKYQSSTLLKKLNKGDHVGACNELLKWTYAKGKQLAGLVARRRAENLTCLTGAYGNE
jgi:lysozyme